MSWKGEKDPYRIWLSEIILQQTRVEQGLLYYNKFISQFPTIHDLAHAEEKVIFKCWEGLGYYNRCRNMISTAKKIAFENKGRFPSDYNEILALKGVGPYTAAAIASFAFSLPYAVVDGNVERVLSRYFGITTPVDSAAGKKMFNGIAQSLLNKKNPGVFNQAMMDFGATVCKPKNPLCLICVQSLNCQAFQNEWISELPVRKKAAPRKTRWLYYFVIRSGKNKYWIRERTNEDIWKNLYEFVLWETGKCIPQSKLPSNPFLKKNFVKGGFQIKYISPFFSQILTHQTIKGCFVHIIPSNSFKPEIEYQSVTLSELKKYPFPKIIKDYISLNTAQKRLW